MIPRWFGAKLPHVRGCTPSLFCVMFKSMKESSNFFAVWGGISGCQAQLGLLLQEGNVRRGIPLSTIGQWTSTKPAARYRLQNKGRIALCVDADMVLVDLSQTIELSKKDLGDRHRISPYLGQKLAGRIRQTLVRGRTVFTDGRFTDSPAGKFIRPA